MTNPRISIIIPFYKSPYLSECISHCLELDYSDFEIIIVSNGDLNIKHKNVKVIITKAIGQADKRDIGIAESSGEICAFIDDDAFPRRDWLKNAMNYFKNPEIGAVGGPGITPPNNTAKQKAGGIIYASVFGGGSIRYRYMPMSARYVDDYPAYNLLIKKTILDKIGGFKTKFRSGEDTQICIKIIENGWKILYVPDVIVYHHRRPLFMPHLKQIRTYGLHRGYFVKKHPETSLRTAYFLPLLFLITLVLSIAFMLINSLFKQLFLLGLLGYFTIGFFSGLWSSKNPKIAILVATGLFLTHLFYSISFIEGLLIKNLGERPNE